MGGVAWFVSWDAAIAKSRHHIRSAMIRIAELVSNVVLPTLRKIINPKWSEEKFNRQFFAFAAAVLSLAR